MNARVLVFTREADVLAFETAAQAASFLESTDVIDGEYSAAFSVAGRVLDISGAVNERVRVEETPVVDLAALAENLTRAHRRRAFTSDPVSPAGVAAELLAAQRAARWPRWPDRWMLAD